jgi:hypothetical protein
LELAATLGNRRGHINNLSHLAPGAVVNARLLRKPARRQSDPVAVTDEDDRSTTDRWHHFRRIDRGTKTGELSRAAGNVLILIGNLDELEFCRNGRYHGADANKERREQQDAATAYAFANPYQPTAGTPRTTAAMVDFRT